MVLIGRRFLDYEDMQPAEGEHYAFKGEEKLEPAQENFGINSETAQQYYERICKEYDQNKEIFNNEPTYNIDLDYIKAEQNEKQYEARHGILNDKNDYKNDYKNDKNDYKNDNNNTIIGPGGIVLHAKPFEEPNFNMIDTDFMMEGYLMDVGDAVEDNDND